MTDDRDNVTADFTPMEQFIVIAFRAMEGAYCDWIPRWAGESYGDRAENVARHLDRLFQVTRRPTSPRGETPGEAPAREEHDFPWGDYLHQRHRMLLWWQAEGKTPEQICQRVAMDPVQVRLILMTPLPKPAPAREEVGARREATADDIVILCAAEAARELSFLAGRAKSDAIAQATEPVYEAIKALVGRFCLAGTPTGGARDE